MESDHTPKALPSAEAQGEDNLTQPKGSGEQPTSNSTIFDEFQQAIDDSRSKELEALISEERRQAKIELAELFKKWCWQNNRDGWIPEYAIDKALTELRGENNE